MNLNAEDVFNPADFESVRLNIKFKNLTTHTEVRDTTTVLLTEIGDRTIVLQLPKKSCNDKHSVMVGIERYNYKARQFKPLLNITGKVSAIEEMEDLQLRVSIDVVQVDERSWNNLLQLYSNRQKQIEEFLASVKGY